MDPNDSRVDEHMFDINVNCMELCGDIVEEDHPGMPEPLRWPVQQSIFVDSDHAGNMVTKHLRLGSFSLSKML